MRLLAVNIRVAGRPLHTYTHPNNPPPYRVGHSGYRAGLYALETDAHGEWMFKLVGELIRPGKNSKRTFVSRESAENHAKQLCKYHKGQYIYMEEIKQYTKIKDLPRGEDILTLFDFYEAIE